MCDRCERGALVRAWVLFAVLATAGGAVLGMGVAWAWLPELWQRDVGPSQRIPPQSLPTVPAEVKP